MIHNLFVNHPPPLQRRRDAKRRVLFYQNAHGGKVVLRFVFVSVEILVPMILFVFYFFGFDCLDEQQQQQSGWLAEKQGKVRQPYQHIHISYVACSHAPITHLATES